MSTDFTKNDNLHKEDVKKGGFFKKYPKASSIITLSLVSAFSLGSAAILHSFTKSDNEVVVITDDSNELNFYNKNYNDAIEGYSKEQQENEWPLDTVKEAEIYSVKGDFEKSNRLLVDAYEKRNKLIDEKGKEKYSDKDAELGNYIAVTALFNGDYKKALDYAEVFLKDNKDSKELNRTTFAIYLANKEMDKAKKILKDYNLDENDSYDLALYARMNMLIGEKNKAFDYLNTAWNLNKDDLKVFDVISEFAENDLQGTIKTLKKLSKNNPDELSYKVWLAKCYSLDESYKDEAFNILNDIEGNDLGDSIIYGIQSKIYLNSSDTEMSSQIINEVINKKDKSYVDYYVISEYNINCRQYDDALYNAEKSIAANKEYPDSYGYLMTEIMIKQKQVENAEPYYRAALRREPFNARLIAKNADYYSNKVKNNDTGFKYYDLASLISPDSSKIYYDLAKINEKNKDNKSAIENMKKAVELNKENVNYHNYLSVLYYNSGKKDDAIKEIRAAYELDNDNIIALNNAGCYYISTGDINRGLENLKGAYDKVETVTDTEISSEITTNYEKAKSYAKLFKDNEKAAKPELNLINGDI